MTSQYRIAEVCERTGLTERAVRLYERRGLLGSIQRGPGNQRAFGLEDLERLGQIARMRRAGIALDDIKLILRIVDAKALGIDREGIVRARALIASSRLQLDIADELLVAIGKRADRYGTTPGGTETRLSGPASRSLAAVAGGRNAVP